MSELNTYTENNKITTKSKYSIGLLQRNKIYKNKNIVWCMLHCNENEYVNLNDFMTYKKYSLMRSNFMLQSNKVNE